MHEKHYQILFERKRKRIIQIVMNIYDKNRMSEI